CLIEFAIGYGQSEMLTWPFATRDVTVDEEEWLGRRFEEHPCETHCWSSVGGSNTGPVQSHVIKPMTPSLTRLRFSGATGLRPTGWWERGGFELSVSREASPKENGRKCRGNCASKRAGILQRMNSLSVRDEFHHIERSLSSANTR